jgi:hypothetical protein
LICICGAISLCLLPIKCKLIKDRTVLIYDYAAALSGLIAALLSSFYTINPTNPNITVASIWISMCSAAFILLKNIK